MKRITLSTDVHVIKTNKIDTLEFRLVYPIKHNNDNGKKIIFSKLEYIYLLIYFFSSPKL